MILNLENSYHILGLSLSFLFSFYLLFNNTNGHKSNIYIGLFIFYLGLENLEVILCQTSFYSSFPNLYLISPTIGFIIYPILFFYIKSIAFKGFQLKRKDFIHVIPFILIVVLNLFEYYFKPLEIKRQIMTNSELKPWFVTVIYYTLHVQALLYLFLSIKVTYRFKKIVKENYSNINKRNYKWILQLTYVFIYFVLTALIYNILRFGTDMSWENKLFYISAPINLAFLIWLIYKAMSQPYIFNGVDANIKLLQEYLNESEHAKQVQEKSFSSEDSNLKNRALKSKLEEYMNKEEAFLNPSLTIFDLAKGLNITSIELSLFLNKELHKNFFDYINEYRIEKAKQILQDPDKKSLTILEILYEVGFNSKSSFNTAFKKFTKKTPTQYRENTVKSRS